MSILVIRCYRRQETVSMRKIYPEITKRNHFFGNSVGPLQNMVTWYKNTLLDGKETMQWELEKKLFQLFE